MCVYIHRFTSSFHIDLAQKVQKWMHDNTLRLASIPDPSTLTYNPETKEYSAQLSFRNRPLEEVRFDAVIDASGVSKYLSDSSPLYRSLKDNDNAKFTPFGGLEVDGKLRVQGTEKLSAALYGGGSPVYGSYFYTNFIIVCAKHGYTIAQDITPLITQ